MWLFCSVGKKSHSPRVTTPCKIATDESKTVIQAVAQCFLKAPAWTSR